MLLLLAKLTHLLGGPSLEQYYVNYLSASKANSTPQKIFFYFVQSQFSLIELFFFLVFFEKYAYVKAKKAMWNPPPCMCNVLGNKVFSDSDFWFSSSSCQKKELLLIWSLGSAFDASVVTLRARVRPTQHVKCPWWFSDANWPNSIWCWS